jgi:hypothetical protein
MKRYKRRNKSNGKYLIFILVLSILLMGTGYSIFSESINVNGTAQSTGVFDVQFQTATVTSSTGCTPTATISGDKNTLTISVPNLAYPGATGTINVTVKNVGNISSKLISANITGNTDPDIVVTFPTFTAGTVLAVNSTYNFDIVVTWSSASTVANKNVNFTATLNYQQNT